MSPKMGHNKKPDSGVGIRKTAGPRRRVGRASSFASPAWAAVPSHRRQATSCCPPWSPVRVALAIAAGLWALAEQNATRRACAGCCAMPARAHAQPWANATRCSVPGAKALIVWGRDGSGPYTMAAPRRCSIPVSKGARRRSFPRRSTDSASAARRSRCRRTTRMERKRSRARPRGRRHGGGVAGARSRRRRASRPISAPSSMPCPFRCGCATRRCRWSGAITPSSPPPARPTWMPRSARAGGAGQDRTRSGRDARAARAQPLEAKRFAVVGGQRRALAFTEIPLDDAGVVGTRHAT